MSDSIEIRGLTERGRHGWFEFETQSGQTFRVDLVLSLDDGVMQAAAASDDLAATVDYGTIAESVRSLVAGDPVRLIETLAERIASTCLADPRVQAVDVTVHKPEAPVSAAVDDIAVRIRRTRG